MNPPAIESEPLPPTTVTRLTPSGRGAVATLVVEGPGAAATVDLFFRPLGGSPLQTGQVDRIRFGTWQHDHGDREEVVACRRAASVIEVHCHGGDAAAAAIVAALVSRGACEGDADAWVQRQHSDPWSQSARRMLAAARTQRTAGILLDQLQDAWPRAIVEIVSLLRSGECDPAAITKAAARIRRLCDLAPVGRHLTRPWKVVIVGLPNVGKSSLVNTMLGFSRCIVFDQPGTTRDIVATHTALDGWPIELMDTAGLREGRDSIEMEGVQRALSQVAAADLVIHVRDATCAVPLVVDPAIDRHPNVLNVENKSDLVASPSLSPSPSPSCDVRTSAVTKAGVDRLIELIVRRLIPAPPLPGEAVPIDGTQRHLLEKAHASLANGQIIEATNLLVQSIDC